MLRTSVEYMSHPLTCFATPNPGFVVGHAGLLQALAMLLVAYFILALTVLSVCAIATNGAVRGGGAYCILKHWWTGVWAFLPGRAEVGLGPGKREAGSNERSAGKPIWER